MPKQDRFEISFAPEVMEHMKAIEKKQRHVIQAAIEEQLRFQPLAETRNRKPLEQPAAFAAEWEIRCGPRNRYRVLYRVDIQDRMVFVLAVGTKIGNKLFVGGEEIEL